MGDVINLRKTRKDKARVEKEKKAEENRLLFGQTKRIKKKTAKEKEKNKKLLDGARRDKNDKESS